jgi:hypothetical protein
MLKRIGLMKDSPGDTAPSLQAEYRSTGKRHAELESDIKVVTYRDKPA